MRSFISALSPYFRLIFADGPFLCNPGPGMIPVYKDYGPYRRWLRWLPEHPAVDDEAAVEELEYNMRSAMNSDEGDGEWVGLLGFSQGAKLAASVLYESQLRAGKVVKEGLDGMYGSVDENEEMVEGLAGGKWRFAVCMAGRAPLVSFSELSHGSKTMVTAGQTSEEINFAAMFAAFGENKNKLSLPTVHVHGTKDPGLHLHRVLLDSYCAPGSTTLVEWEGEHRIPLKSIDVNKVVEAILKVAKVNNSCFYVCAMLILAIPDIWGSRREGNEWTRLKNLET